MRTGIGGLRLALLAAGLAIALGAASSTTSVAQASFAEYYGGGSLCGSICYIQSAGAHTFIVNEGWSETGSPTLACQLFNSKAGGPNEVTHGAGYCGVYYFGGEYVWARVYNESGKTYVVTGYAET